MKRTESGGRKYTGPGRNPQEPVASSPQKAPSLSRAMDRSVTVRWGCCGTSILEAFSGFILGATA